MVNYKIIRSISFDTSFLLKNSIIVDEVIKILKKDRISCFITSVVLSELEQLKIWGRIDQSQYHKAIKRWKSTKATIIDFRNRFLSSEFGKTCIQSMEKHHGVKSKDIVNDCNIIVTTLKNGINIFLSEDFHFTSKITKKVIEDVSNVACNEYNLMCDSNIYNIDSRTFIEAYNNKELDIDLVESKMKTIKKSKKQLF